MKVLSKGELFAIGKDSEPAIEIDGGESIQVDTEDAFRGLVRKVEEATPEVIHSILEQFNPLSGPIYVKGADPGDALEILIENIECGEYGVTIAGPHFCQIPDWFPEFKTKVVAIKDGRILFNDKIQIPVDPMIGTIATAPKEEILQSSMQGPFGGNMDTAFARIGSKVLLPVEIPGGLLSLGDVHAIQGDGELGNPFEIPATCTLNVKIKEGYGEAMKCPRIIDKENLVTVCADKPFEVAAQMALKEMIRWLEHEHDFDQTEAIFLLPQIADVRVGQIANTFFTACCVVPKRYFSSYVREDTRE